jgi:hypothetical protein
MMPSSDPLLTYHDLYYGDRLLTSIKGPMDMHRSAIICKALQECFTCCGIFLVYRETPDEYRAKLHNCTIKQFGPLKD